MYPAPNRRSQKSARGRPPVVTKNLRACLPPGLSKQKSRPVAAPRRSMAGTCEKPSMNRASIACVALRWPDHPGDRAIQDGCHRSILAADQSQVKEAERPNQPNTDGMR
jgi:hypothetical protein